MKENGIMKKILVSSILGICLVIMMVGSVFATSSAEIRAAEELLNDWRVVQDTGSCDFISYSWRGSL